MGYSLLQISEILLKSDKTTYKLGTVAYENMFSEDNEDVDFERDIIYIYKKAVEYADDLYVGTLKLDQVVERLGAKLNIYNYGTLAPIYADVYSQVDQGLNIIYVLKTTELNLGPGLTGSVDFSQPQIDIDIDYTHLNSLYVQLLRTITINGVTYDLSQNRTWNLNLDSVTDQGSVTTNSITVGSVYLTNMTAGSGALYYGIGSNRLTLANYNAGGTVYVEVNGGAYAAVFGADLSFTSFGTIGGVFNAAATDTDKFIVSDGGVLKYRTGAELLSDIGAQPSGSYVPTTRTITINGTTYDLSANRTWNVGTVTGTGTTNYVPKWTSAGGIGDSIIYDNGQLVAIGTTVANSNFNNGLLVSNTGNANLEVRAGLSEQSSLHLTTGISDSSTTPRVELFNSGNFGIVMYRPGVVSSNYLMYYDSDSLTNRKLSFQTEGSDRFTINQNGTSRFNAYTTNGFVKFSNSDGTLSVDTTIYQPILTNPVTGTGTINNLPKWTSVSGLGNSIIDDDGVSASVALLTGGAFNIKYLSAIKLALTGGSTFGSIDLPVGIDFLIRPDSIEKFKLSSTGLLRLAQYGSGAVTGTSTYRLGVDASGNVIEVTDGGGTVTSVDMTVPTGLTISGNPITTSGTLALGLAAGYSIPTTANQANWTTAYNDSIISAGVSGTTTKVLTLTQQDGGTITASWTDINTDAVTSVFGRLGAVVAQSGDYTTTLVTEGTNLYYLDSRARSAISLTTIGTSGVATYDNITGIINIPNYGSVLTGYVPYLGAIQNVDLGEFEIKAGQFTLDVSPTGVATVGTTRWNNTIGSSETTLKGGSVILKNGVDLVARVVNKVFPNATLTKAQYQAVRVSGAQGQRLAVAYAQANNDNSSADTIGLVAETINTNQEGFIITVGQLEDINTTGSLQGETWVDGDVLYLSPTTPGAITNVKPVAPQHIIIIGYVEYAHAVHGKIYVKTMNGWELGELHDVNTIGATAGQVLKFNGTIWTPSSDVGITSLNGLNGTTQTFAVGTSGTDFNISSATTIHTFNLPTASATNRGVLSAADWSLFNSKQNALTNPVTGTGTSGQVAFFGSTSGITGENNFVWNALYNRLGVNTNNPYLPVDIVADELGYNLGLRGEPSNAVANIRFYSNDGVTPYSHIKSTDTEFLLGSIATNDVIFVSSGVEGIRITSLQEIKFSNIPQAVTDTNRFLVSDVGYIKYRTGAEVLSDIGAQGLLTLTTTGSSGSATLISNTLNIPTYTLSGLGGVPTSRTLTINGTTYDLSADRSWTIVAGVSSVNAGTGISVNQTTGSVTVTNTGVLSVNGSTGAITGIATTAQLGNYLPLSGGTMTGVITTPNGTFGIIIGDDSRLADRNIANTLFLEGIQNNDRGYINFSSTSGNSLGAVNGGPLTWNGNTILHAGNYTTYAVQTTTQNNWNSYNVIANVVGLLGWKNYGNGHVIFDASASTSPSGGGISSTDSQIPWASTYPTLMGWNGTNTYGVRVDRARLADNADTVDGYHATNAASGLAYYASNGYLYAPAWINVDNGGIFSGTNSAHFRPNPYTFGAWLISGSKGGYAGIEFDTLVNGNISLMIATSSNLTGFYNTSYGWQFYWNGGTLYVFKNTYGGGTQATVLDSTNYNSYAVPISGYTFGTTFSLGTMYVSTGEQSTPSYLLGVYSNGYTYKFSLAGIQSWIGLGSYLPISGGTMSGGINMGNNSITNASGFSGTNFTVGNAIYFGGGNNYFNWDGARINSNVGIQSGSDMRAPIFYDSEDTGYYINPNGGSVLYSLYLNAVESANLYGIRGRFTNEYIHLYNKVGIGDPNGWGSGQTSTPAFGLSTYGGANFAYGNGALSTFNGQVNIKGSSMYVSASQLHIGQQSSGTAQMSFESWGSYTGALAMNSSGQFHWGGQGASSWYWKTYCTYNGDYSTSGNTVLSLSSGGSLSAIGDMRAPVFYDSQDTNYYVDPNSMSVLRSLQIGAYNQYSTSIGAPGNNFGNGRVYLYIWPIASGSRIMSVKINISSTWNWAAAFGFITADVSFYFDGTNLYLAETTITSATGQARLNLGIGQPVLVNGFVAIPIYSANTNSIFAKLEGAPAFDWNVVSWGSWESVGFPGAAVVNVPGGMTVGGAFTAGADGVFGNNRTSNDAGTTTLSVIGSSSSSTSSQLNLTQVWNGVNYPIVLRNIYNPTAGAASSLFTLSTTQWNGSAAITTERLRIDGDNGWATFANTVVSSSSFRAPIFYDSQDTGYYVDPNQTSVLNELKTLGQLYINNYSPTVYFQDIDHRSAMIHVNSNIFYVLRGSGNNSTSWSQYNGYWPLEINLENNSATFGGTVSAPAGDMRAPIFYDSNNTAYFLDPNSFSNLYSANFASTVNFASATNWFGGYGPGSGPGIGLENQGTFARFAFWGLDFYDWNDGIMMTINNGYVSATGSFRAPIFYDSQNTDYYIDPNATSNIYKIRIGNGSEILGLIGMGASYLYGMGINNAYTAIHAHSSANGVALGSYDGTTFTAKMYVNHDGNAYAVSSFRAPIFYDSQDTGYFLDPNSNSNLNNVVAQDIRGRKNQTAGSYTTAALWTESYGNTATGIAFHISGVVGKFLEMRTNGVLYWENNQVVTNTGTWNISITGNADTVDGLHASAFATRQDGTRFSTNYNSILSSGFYNAEGQPANAPNAYGQLIVARGIDTGLQIAGGYNSENLWFRGWGYGPEADGFYAWRKVLHDGNYNTYSPTLTGTGASGTWNISITGNASTATNADTVDGYHEYAFMRYYGYSTSGNFQSFQSTPGRLRFDQVGDINSGAWSNQPTGVYTYGGVLSFRGDSFGLQIYGSHTGDLVFKTQWNDDQYSGWRNILHSSNYNSYSPTLTGGNASGTWGINITGNAQYLANNYIGQTDANTIWRAGSYTFFNGVNVPGGDFGLISVPTWSSTDSNSRYNLQLGANIGGPLRYRSTNINGAGSWATILSDANYNSYAPTLTGSGASGLWSINITGSAGSVSWGNVSNKPANWLTEPNLIYDNEPNNPVPSGFWQNYAGANNPTGTWFNYINVRHINTGNVHGYQLGMSYYDNNLWFRSYQGMGSYLPWSRALGTYTDPYPSNMNQYVRTTDNVSFNYVNAPSGYVSNGNPWGTGISAYFPNGITTAGTDNWIYGHTYIGNAPANGNGHEFWSDGNMRSTGYHKATIYYDNADTTYYLDPNAGSYLRGRIDVTGGHYNSSLRVFLRADENGASSGVASLQMWVSEPNVTWAAGGFGYNVTNDGAGNGFSRINTSFGQAYMRFSTDGDLIFYNTNTSGSRVTTALFWSSGAVTFNYSVTASSFFESSDERLKKIVDGNYRLDSITSIKPKFYEKNGRLEAGYIAQEVQKIYSHAVQEGTEGYLNLSYTQVHTLKIAYLEDSVDDLKKKIKELEEKLNSLY